MKPRGDRVTVRPTKAPMTPKGTVSMTVTDFMTELNWMTIAKMMSARDTLMTAPISERFCRNSFSSPASVRLYPGGRGMAASAGRARSNTLDASSPKGG